MNPDSATAAPNAVQSRARAIRQRINESTPLDSLVAELARQQVQIEELELQLRAMRAQQVVRDVLLPQAIVTYKGVSVAHVDAGMPLDARRGFYSLEYDGRGRPFRWTGPSPSFYFDIHLDRSAPLQFTLSLASGLGEASDEVRAFCDGAELVCQRHDLSDATEWTGILYPREALGLTRLTFLPRQMFSPAASGGDEADLRTLGVVFRELHVMAISDAEALTQLRADERQVAPMTSGAMNDPSLIAPMPAPSPPEASASTLARQKHKRGGRR